MVWLRFGSCACLLAASLCSATINVSTQQSVTLETGDTLIYSISAYSYLVHAPQLGGPADPSAITVSLLADPLIGSLGLGLSLESYGGGVSAPMENVSQEDGYFAGSLYQGPVTGETGFMQLSPDLSSELFSGPAVLLEVQDLGGEVTLGLPPYAMLQSLEVSLSGSGFSVGGVVAAVTLEPAQAPEMSALASPMDAFASPLDDELDAVPEPSSGALLALGGACLALAALFLKRRSRAVLFPK
jgi:hypothetical protein